MQANAGTLQQGLLVLVRDSLFVQRRMNTSEHSMSCSEPQVIAQEGAAGRNPILVDDVGMSCLHEPLPACTNPDTFHEGHAAA